VDDDVTTFTEVNDAVETLAEVEDDAAENAMVSGADEPTLIATILLVLVGVDLKGSDVEEIDVDGWTDIDRDMALEDVGTESEDCIESVSGGILAR